jgi:hypothetical protein
VEDSWETVLADHFTRMEDESAKKGDKGVIKITSQEVYQILGIPLISQDERISERLSAIMQSLGFKYLAVRIAKYAKPVKGWKRLPYNPYLPDDHEA